jgi:hypothetical protein
MDIKSADDKSVGNDNKTANNQENTETSKSKHVKWSPENELIIVEWCDIAQCYKWMNSRSHEKLARANAWFTIPAIILSTVSGTASFAQKSLPSSFQTLAPLAIGTVNIFIGILTTIQQYLKISELNEAHRVSAISWDKFARNIRIELAKDPDERMEAGSFLKLCRSEFDRLMETSPSINPSIAKEFKDSFSGQPNSIQRKRYEELRKPDICNIIISANESRHPWYISSDLNKMNSMDSYMQNEQQIQENIKIRIIEGQHKMEEYEILQEEKKIEEQLKHVHKESMRKELLEKMLKQKNDEEKIDSFVDNFIIGAGRKPHEDEIIANMRGIVDMESIVEYLENYTILQQREP